MLLPVEETKPGARRTRYALSLSNWGGLWRRRLAFCPGLTHLLSLSQARNGSRGGGSHSGGSGSETGGESGSTVNEALEGEQVAAWTTAAPGDETAAPPVTASSLPVIDVPVPPRAAPVPADQCGSAGRKRGAAGRLAGGALRAVVAAAAHAKISGFRGCVPVPIHKNWRASVPVWQRCLNEHSRCRRE